MSDIIIPTTRESAIMSILRDIYGPLAQIQEGQVRLEKVLKANDVAQRFNLNGDGSTKRPLESFIGLNDLVIPYAMKIAVNKVKDVAVGNNGNSDDLTYTDITVFPTAATGTAVSEADALKAIWAGNFSIKANTVEIQNTYQNRRFYISPQTQASATTTQELNSEGFQPLWQTSIFSGQDTNILDFSPAPGADLQQIGGTAPSQNILVIHFLTFTARNGAQAATWTQLGEVSKKIEKYTKGGQLLF